VIPSLANQLRARFTRFSAVNPFSAINSAGLVVSPRFQAKVSRFVVLRSMIGSNIPLAPAVTPIKALPQTVLQHHQNRHRVQHSYPKLHRWDIQTTGLAMETIRTPTS